MNGEWHFWRDRRGRLVVGWLSSESDDETFSFAYVGSVDEGEAVSSMLNALAAVPVPPDKRGV